MLGWFDPVGDELTQAGGWIDTNLVWVNTSSGWVDKSWGNVDPVWAVFMLVWTGFPQLGVSWHQLRRVYACWDSCSCVHVSWNMVSQGGASWGKFDLVGAELSWHKLWQGCPNRGWVNLGCRTSTVRGIVYNDGIRYNISCGIWCRSQFQARYQILHQLWYHGSANQNPCNFCFCEAKILGHLIVLAMILRPLQFLIPRLKLAATSDTAADVVSDTESHFSLHYR